AVVSLPVVYLSLWRLDRKNAGLLVAALVFLAFHYFSTIEVMGGHARFYAPAIPLVAAAAMTGSDRPPSWRRLGFHLVFAIAYTVLVWWLFQHRWIPDNKVWNINRVAPALYVAYVAGAWLLVLSPRKLAGAATYAILFVSMVGLWVAHPFSTRTIPSDEAYLAAELGHRSGFHGIDRLARCIGPNIAIYHSEIGLPGVAMPEAEITDLVGLMTPAFAFGDVSFDDYCLADPPEAIFLPHRNYKRLRHAVQSSQCLRGYVRITKGGSPLYIRRDLMATLRACPGR
ncbi:MAG TPA: hypothetical protein VFG83_01555, partial [Kofleriaceae bacterium]|nr:hypothetical protein [Kofleriaceae bacterium]